MIGQAFAQGSSIMGDLGSLSTFVPLILIFIVFYFFLIRPQQKKVQQHKEMVGGLRRGDRIVTNGGLMGSVVQVIDEREIEVEISKGVQVHVVRSMVADVVSKTQPVMADTASPKESKVAETKAAQLPAKSTPKKSAPSGTKSAKSTLSKSPVSKKK